MKTFLLVLTTFLLSSCGSKEVENAKAGAEHTQSKAEEGIQDAKAKAKEAQGTATQATDKSVEEGKKAAGGGGDSTSLTCTSGKDERSITKAVNEQGGCEVVYTKNGESNSVANAKTDTTYCDNMMDRIKGNLESAGFTCK